MFQSTESSVHGEDVIALEPILEELMGFVEKVAEEVFNLNGCDRQRILPALDDVSGCNTIHRTQGHMNREGKCYFARVQD